MTRISVGEARKEMADILNHVAYKGWRVVLHRRGKDVAAIVSLDDLELIEELEDAADTKAALLAEARAEERGEKPIAWEAVKAGLEL
jgi:prevent-host-death family protein